ncbi:RNA polymerase I, second largest subunit, partial [Pseudoloma neurophilia]
KTADQSNNHYNKSTVSKLKNRTYLYEKLAHCMRLLGLNQYSNEMMISGVTGLPLRNTIFTGMCYYQRLRHMVSDKWQVRSTGLINCKTRQPIKGRKKGGGVRFGEMEKIALLAHGTSYLLQDRLMDCSDRCTFFICLKCKTFLFVRNGICLCGSKELKVIQAPFVLKYLLSELLAMNITVEIESTAS